MSHSPSANRRAVMKSMVSLTLASFVPAAYGVTADPEIGSPLAARQPGEMDIHHIDTGRGNCTLIVGPDGTSIMIDAGAGNGPKETSAEARPDASKRPGEWQAAYAQRWVPDGRLDYFVATHLHADHIGDLSPSSPLAVNGAYHLTGVSDVDARLPIVTVIDRAYPDYGQMPPLAQPFADNYLAYLKDRMTHGRKVERVAVGSREQIRLRDASRFPEFEVRMLAASGRVWTGTGDEAESHVPDLSTIAVEERPGENIFSVAMRFRYGKFSYYTGGDLSCDTRDGRVPWMDVETPVVRAAGRTEVAAADHHGYFDACGPEFVNKLDAQAFIVQSWDVGHPGTAQMQRMLGAWTTKTSHDVFVTNLLPQNALINNRFAPKLKSRSGHVVIRVAKGGATYRIFVVDSTRDNGAVTAVIGPYTCRA